MTSVSIRRFPALGDDIFIDFLRVKNPQLIHYRNSSTIDTTLSAMFCSDLPYV